ncbi:MAG: oxidoreductase [Acidobacteria bacterium RIFCSPLOWO2_12_FULL_67_14]|nr:MAG: oxidoreductase [Acidobacteria bacterium RIFCSPLOWO2_02_FULL_67_21]OFW35240.1 MAG: oxidoreductase [Acidobacteria bacterium RIFCSPLOWO2_12_FULL_67_14]
MGQPIIGHMVRRGFTVRAFDIDPAKRDAVAQLGAGWAASPAELALGSDAILVCVGYDRELRGLVSAAGLLRDAARGTIVAVLSTVHPRTVQELADAARPLDVHVVDTTVARGGRAADAGTLLAFLAGDAGVVARLTPVFASFSADIVHTGGVGTAQVAKAANNLVMWACLIANHEALALARRFGVDVDRLREALLMSSADNYVLRHWGENTMAWADDDLEIIEAMARDAGIGLPQTALNRKLCRTLKPKRFKLDEYGV